MEAYYLLTEPGTGEYEEKRSRFLALACPVRSEEEALRFLAERRKIHYGARHHCYAYVLGSDNKISRFSDDGEPSGTAGKPILEVLLASGLHNALVVVTRYFGGTLLGTGGLVRAYSAAASEALKNAGRGLLYSGSLWQILCEYNDLGRIERLIESMELLKGDTEFAADVSLRLYLKDGQEGAFLRELADATSGAAVAEKLEDLCFLANEKGAVPFREAPEEDGASVL